jgi:transposase-like protein
LGPKLGVGPETLRKWIVQAQVDGGARPGPSSEELTEIKALKSQVRDLTEANEILKAASVLKLDADAVVDRPSGGVEAENLACRLESGSPVDRVDHV